MADDSSHKTSIRAERLQDLLVVAVLTLAGAGTRLLYLFQPVRLDEIQTFFAYIQRPLFIALTKNNPPNNQFFHTLLVKASIGVFGPHDWAMRLPAYIAGIAMIPLTYLVVRRLFDRGAVSPHRWAAILAAGLVAGSSHLVDYSTSARGYTIQAVLVIGLVLLGLRLERRRATWSWAAFALLAILTLYTIPTSVYFVGAVVVWLGIAGLRRYTVENRAPFLLKLAASGAAAGLVTVLLYVPVITTSGLASVTSNPMVQPMPFGYFLQGTVKLAWDTFRSWNVAIGPVLGILLLICFVAGLVFFRRLSTERVDPVLIMLVFSVVALLVQRSVPFTRTWIPLLPFYFGTAAAGGLHLGSSIVAFAREKGLKARPSAGFALVAVVVLSCFLCALVIAQDTPYQANSLGVPAPESSFKDARAVADYLKDNLRPGDIVYIDHFAEPTLEFYLTQEGVPPGYLFANNQGADTAAEPRRVIVVLAGSEGHGYEPAVFDWATAADLQNAEILKMLPCTVIMATEVKR
ncbi:MAG: glycosyltransferase family 39 protein [Actinobacteria bacterium]|nr:glycosyltransferase family 39 protein [Actinomycetota bacterium]